MYAARKLSCKVIPFFILVYTSGEYDDIIILRRCQFVVFVKKKLNRIGDGNFNRKTKFTH